MPQRRRVCVLHFVCCSVKLVPSLRRPGSDPLLLQPCVVFASALDAGGGSDLAHLLTLYGGGRDNLVLLPHGVLEEVKVGVARAAVLQSASSAQMCCLSCVAQALRHPPWCTTFSTRACIHACIHVYP